MRDSKKLLLALFGPLAGFLAALVGYEGLLARLSYDLPFLIRGNVQETNTAIIYVDGETLRELGREADGALGRQHLARLVNRLTDEGARLILLDFVFESSAGKEEQTKELADALRKSGRVILGADYHVVTENPTHSGRQVAPPTSPLRESALAWGHLALQDLGPDRVVRRMPQPIDAVLPASWVVATNLAPPDEVPVSGASSRRQWLNPYGPVSGGVRSTFPLHRVLVPGEIPVGIFSNKVVLVGGGMAAAAIGETTDQFGTPWSRFGGQPAVGVDVHAVAVLNRWQKSHLRRLAPAAEAAVAAVCGAVLSAIALLEVRRRARLWMVLLCTTAFVGTTAIQHFGGWWWNWASLLFIQLPLGLVAAAWISDPCRYYVFISYRRSKEQREGQGGQVQPKIDGGERLARQYHLAFGRLHKKAFLDATDIGAQSDISGPAMDDAIRAVRMSRSLIVLLTPGIWSRWLAQGNYTNAETRLSHEAAGQADAVIREVLAARDAGIPVVLVRIQGYTDPDSRCLPESLKTILRYPQEWHIENRLGDVDVRHICKAIERKRS